MRAGLFPGQGLDAAAVLDALDPSHEKVRVASELVGCDIVRRVAQVAGRPRSVLPTKIAQPAILTAGVIAFEERTGGGERFDFLVGHSLGEYTALVAAGAMSFADGVRLVGARGEAMHRAAMVSRGRMAAVRGLPFETVESLATQHNLTVANDNSPRQVVLSGEADDLARCADTIRSNRGRCVLLALEGAFHSQAMAPAVRALDEALTFTNIRCPSIPVVANVTALPYRAPGEIRKLLSQQVTQRVRFRESIAYVVERGVDEFVDLGPGSVVGKLAKETAENLKEIARV